MPMSLKNNQKLKALVTGSSRGIGFAIASKLLEDGIDVITTGTGKKSTAPIGSEYKQVDFLDDSSFNEFLKFVKSQKIDILVNNAGINRINKFNEIKTKDFDDIIKVNLRSPFLLCQAVTKNMELNGWGRIVNVTSIFGTISKKHRASYSSSKFGLDGMTVALAAELSKFGILANSVGPGFIQTDMTKSILGKSGIKEIEKEIPIARLGEAKEVADLVSWLVSDSNSYLTGQNLIIDGGFSRV